MQYQGYIPSTATENINLDARLVSKQGSPEFADFQTKGLGAGKLSTPYKSVTFFYPKAFADEAQTTGDCTSHGTRNAIDIARAIEIHNGDPEGWHARTATEPIYGYRGHSGEGMSPALATEFVTKYGSLLRQKFQFEDVTVDLTKYNSKIGSNWGRSGPPKEVKDAAALHPARYFARIRSIEEARDALAAGYGIHVGSGYGNDGKRDKNGLSRRNSSWNHDMAWGACDDIGPDMTFLVLNSWGAWNSGGHPQWGPIPEGSFLIPSADAAWCIRNGEAWAVGDVHGFPPKQLPDYGTTTFLGA